MTLKRLLCLILILALAACGSISGAPRAGTPAPAATTISAPTSTPVSGTAAAAPTHTLSPAPAGTAAPIGASGSELPIPIGGEEQAAEVDALLAAVLAEDAPGGAAIVIQDGQVRYMEGHGLADVERGTPNTPRTMFHMASAGKQFTALGVMMLAEQGKLAYDDPIGKHLPELAHFGERLTIRHLLNHTSGIPDYYRDAALQKALENRSAMPTNADALAVLAQGREPRFPPGQRFAYSNAGYEVLGSLIERVSGRPFPEFLRERVFEPLGMAQTFSVPNPAMLAAPERAIGYNVGAGGFRVNDSHPLDNLVGAGSVYASVADLYRYDQALYTDKLVSQAMLAEAFRPAQLNDGTQSQYGFGWTLGEHDSIPYVAHSGAWVGFRAYYLRFPGRRLSAIVLLNRSDVDPEPLAFAIADVYL